MFIETVALYSYVYTLDNKFNRCDVLKKIYSNSNNSIWEIINFVRESIYI